MYILFLTILGKYSIKVIFEEDFIFSVDTIFLQNRIL